MATTADDPQEDHGEKEVEPSFWASFNRDDATGLASGNGDRPVFGIVVPDVPLRDHQTLLEALQAGVIGQLAILDDSSLTGTGKSSAQVLGVATEDLGQKLASHLAMATLRRGAPASTLVKVR